MTTTHIIFGDFSKKRVSILQKYGFNIHKIGFERLDIEENTIYWEIKPLLDEWNFSDHSVSKFSKDEIDKSKYLVILPRKQAYYPQPENSFLENTFDLSNYSEKLGTGLKQKAPFRIKSEPKWTKNRIFGLYWIHDEFFVHIETFENVFKPIGIKSIPVLYPKKDIEIKSVVQLILPESTSPLILDNYPFLSDEKNNHKKYKNINSGFFPNFVVNPTGLTIFKSQEYFGTGKGAFKAILTTQEFRRKMIEENLSLIYYPMEI